MEQNSPLSVPARPQPWPSHVNSVEAVKLWLSERFAHERDPQAILALVAETLGTFLGVSRVGYGEVQPGEDSFTVLLDWTDGLASMVGRQPLFRDSAIVREYSLGRTLVVSDVATLDLDPAERDLLEATRCRSFVSVPLIHDGEFVALFSVTHRDVRSWTDDEVQLVAQTGARTWSALQYARALAELESSEEQFRTLAENVPGICWIAGPDGNAFWMNRIGQDYLGGLKGSPADAAEVIHPDDLQDTLAAWKHALSTGERLERVVRVRGVDGIYRPFLSRAEPVHDPDGKVVRWCTVQVDLSEQHAQAHRQAILRSFSDRTRELTDPDAILALLAETVGRELGAARFSYVEVSADDPDIFQRFAWRHDQLHGWVDRNFNFDTQLRHVLHLHRGGLTFVSEDMLADAREIPELETFATTYGVRAAIAAPIVREGRLLASVSVLDEVPRRWTRDEIALLCEFAERGWASIARARAEAELRVRERSQALLIDWSDRVRGLDNPDAIVGTTLELLGQRLGVARVTHAEADQEAGLFCVTGEWCAPAIASIRGNRFTLPQVGTAVDRAWLAGEVIRYDDTGTDPRLEPAARERYAARQIGAFVSVPLILEGRIHSALSVQSATPRVWQEHEVQLLREVAERTWGVLERARAEAALQERERNQAFLLEWNDQLRGERDPQAILSATLRSLGEFLGTARATYVETSADYVSITIIADWKPDGTHAVGLKAPLAMLGRAVLEHYVRGSPLRVDDIPNDPRFGEDEAHLHRHGDTLAFLAVPLVRDGRVAAILSVQQDRPRRWSESEFQLVRDVAERTWAVVERARAEAALAQRERDQAFLIGWSDQVRPQRTASGILSLSLARLGEHLGASRTSYAEMDMAGGDYTIVAEWGPGLAPIAGTSFPAAVLSDTVRDTYLAGQPMVSDDLAAEERSTPAARERFARSNIGARIGIPLSRGGTVRAILAIDQTTPRHWTDREIQLAREVADRIWDMLERARAEQALKERERDRAFLLEWSDALRAETSPDAVVTGTLERLARYLAISRANFAERDGDDFVIVKEWRRDGGGDGMLAGERAGISDGLNQAYLTGEIVVVDDIYTDPRISPESRDRYAAVDAVAFLGIPLVRGGRVRAVLSVQCADRRQWHGAEIQLLRDVADRTWVSLERARAEAALQDRERHQAFLIEWSDRVRGESSPRAILDITLDLLGRHLSVSRANYAEATHGGDALEVLQEWRNGIVTVMGQLFPLEALGEAMLAAHFTGEPVVVADTHADPLITPATQAVYDGVGIGSFLSIPLVRNGVMEAVLSVQQDAPRRWSDNEVALVRDIADRTWAVIERARSEERLGESEALLAAFMENAPLGMHLKDAAGRYIRINPELAEALGRPMEEIIGAHPNDLFPPAIAEVIEDIEAKARAGELASAEFHGGTRERWRSVMSMVFPIKGRGNARTAGLTIDITERKQAEDALARSREALYQTEKLSALGSLLAGVSHELNNPLSIVVAQAVMMERQAKGTEIAERAQKVRRAADRCARIVQTFLAMARQKRPERELVDLNGVVTAALELADYGLRTEGISVTKQLAPDLPPIPADADQLHQVVINLVINAQQALVQAGVPERHLTIITARGPEPDTVILDVADNGPGVPVEVQRRIFEPFYTTKPQGEGTGVGLSFSQGLAEAHGGRLVLVPSPVGALFRLTLPVDAGQTLPKVAPEVVEAPPPVQRRALVIDDEEEIAESLADFLSVEGYHAEIAVGGRAAIDRLHSGESFDLVVSDLRMPEVDGPQLHAWIARERPELLPRLAFATGDTLGAAVARFLEEAQRPVLEKPFMPDAVARFLKQVEDA